MAFAFDPKAYGPVFADLLAEERVPPLGPGRPNEAVRDRLREATTGALFAHARIGDRSMAEACLSGLWLYHDFLDESHTLSQGISTPTGSFWHGIMHRREPDFSNAKYWFRRVGQHPVFEPLAGEARALASGNPDLTGTAVLADVRAWDPFAFVDQCEQFLNRPGADHTFCRRLSLVEWQLLFDFCYRRATGNE